VKVLFVVDGLWVGGTERSIVEMLPHLEAAGISPTVACFRSCAGEGVEDRVAPERLRLLAAGRGLAGRVRALRGLLRELRPAIVHSALFGANLATRLAAPGLPVVVLNSLVNTPYEPARLADPRLSRWRVRLAQLADAVTGRFFADHFHAVSHAAAAAAVRAQWVPRGRITVVERGRDPGRLGVPSAARRRAARERLGLGEATPVLVNVGRHEYQKGQGHLLRAIARLAGRDPAPVALIAGRTGISTRELEALHRELALGERVRFLGHRDDVPEILAAADLFVFPSLFEGFPGAVVEAMALGLPVVAADVPPVREAVEPGRTALLVPPEDDAALAAAIERLLDDPAEAAALGARGREVFVERLTLAASVPRMIELYRRLAALG